MKQKQVKITPKNAKQIQQKKTVTKTEHIEDSDEDVSKKVLVNKKLANKRTPFQKVGLKLPVEVEEEDDAEVEEQYEETNEIAEVKMKQKHVKVAPKTANQIKTIRKTPLKKAVYVEDSDDNVGNKKTNKKTPLKARKVEIEAPMEDEGEDDEENDVDEEADAEDDDHDMEEDTDDDVEDDVENDVDDDVEDDDEEDNEEENGDNEDHSENEEPTIPSTVKSGEIPETVPSNRVIHISHLPRRKCKKVDIVEAFAKYGAIEQIHMLITSSGTVANVAFKTEKAANAALAADKKVRIQNALIWVSLREANREHDKNSKEKLSEIRDRSVFVRLLKYGTTEKQLEEHFENCGEIESVKLIIRSNKNIFGFVTFVDQSARENALKLHNSILNNVNIGVSESNDNRTRNRTQYDEKRTIMIKNVQGFENIESSVLENIFANYGENEMDIVCGKVALAFITFKTEEAAQNALEMNGKTVNDIELKMKLYNIRKTIIYVSNLPKDCSDDDLRTYFSRAGEISEITNKGYYAIIRFEDSDGYCKSFLYTEGYINNKMIFVEPHSTYRKRTMMKSTSYHKKNLKRRFENGNGVFTPKKAKFNE